MKAEIPRCIPQEFAGLLVLRSGSRLTARCLSAVGGSRMKLMIQRKGNNCGTLGMTEAGRSHTIRCGVSGPRNTKRTDFRWQWAAACILLQIVLSPGALEIWNIRTRGFLTWIKSVHRRECDLPLGSLCVSERGNRKSCCSNGFLLEIWRFFCCLGQRMNGGESNLTPISPLLASLFHRFSNGLPRSLY